MLAPASRWAVGRGHSLWVWTRCSQPRRCRTRRSPIEALGWVELTVTKAYVVITLATMLSGDGCGTGTRSGASAGDGVL